MKNYTKETLRIYWQHASKQQLAIVAVLAGSALGIISDVYQPILYKDLLNQLVGGDTVTPYNTVTMILLALIIQWTGWRTATFADSFFVSRLTADLYNSCFRYIHGHSYNYFNSNFTGSLVRRVNRYSKSFENVSDKIIWNLWPTTLSVLFILTVLISRHWILAAVLLAWMIGYLLFLWFFMKYKLKFDVKRAQVDTQVSGYLADTLTNNINIKLFSNFDFEFKSFSQLTERLFRSRWLVWRIESVGEAVQSGLMIILEFSIIWIAISLWQRGMLTIGDFALIQAYVIKIFRSTWDIGRNIQKIFESLADANEMTEILVTPHEVADIEAAPELQVTAGSIVFSNTQFAYNQKRPVLRNFNLTVKPGERVALIGPSGGGKSTIIKLLLRFLDIKSGEIFIDNQNIAMVTQDSLRSQIALVPQEPILFHRSLLENIRYAKPDATDDEVIKAAKLAHCHEFISSFPEKYETLVGERGVKLSGGERQRVAIARAMLKDAPIILLDEATSSLDSESERFIQGALHDLMAGRTTIVIAHRLSTIMQMDRIVVIQKGKVIEEGTHHELLKVNQGTYQKLWNIQAGSFASE